MERFSQKQRDLVLKISGFHPTAWGARGVYVGSDLSGEEWTAQVRTALAEFGLAPAPAAALREGRDCEPGFCGGE